VLTTRVPSLPSRSLRMASTMSSVSWLWRMKLHSPPRFPT
jgi:hypothetical protein